MQRLINCDFLNASAFKVNLTNDAKLLYFYFLINADDKGFVANAKELCETLDRCKETLENTLFQIKYGDALQELVDKRLLFAFTDKVGNTTYLIRHWFLHNRYRPNLRTNFVWLLTNVELVDGKYQLVERKEKPFKEKQSKINQNKINQNNINNINNNSSLIESSNNDDNSKPDWEKQWDFFLNDINTYKGEPND